MKLGHVMIFVTDLEKAKWFYSDLLGLEVTFEEGNKVVFALDGLALVAFTCEKNGDIGDYSNEARSVLVFEVESVENAFQDMKSKGIRFLHDKPTEGRYAAFVDPFENVHEIAERAN